MTVDASADHFAVVDHVKRTESERIYIVAIIAIITGIEMVSGFANRNRAVVTAHTITDEGAVIRHIGAGHVKPVCRVLMASVAFRCRYRMCGALPTRQYAIVTARTNADGLVMIHAGR